MGYREAPVLTFQANAALGQHLRVRFNGSGKLVLVGASETDCLGTLTRQVLAADEFVGVRVNNAPGSQIMIASGAITKGDAVYAAASGKVAGSGTVLVGEALETVTADGDGIEVLPSVVAGVPRSLIVQEDLSSYAIPISAFRVWNAPATVLPATPATDDLGVIDNTFATAAPTIESGDGKATTIVRKARFQFPVPKEYVDGESITIRVNAGMKTTVSDDTATLDLECVRQADAGSDICATALQSINSLVAADVDFVITPTGVVSGDILDVVLTIAITDASTGTAVIGQINSVEVLADIKG